MKKSFITCALLSATLVLTAQNTNSDSNGQTNGQGVIHWKLDGNQAADDHFIGTVNEKPLIFKSNNLEGLRLTPEGRVYFNQVDTTLNSDLDQSKIALIHKNGNLSVMSSEQLVSMVYRNDCFGHEIMDQDGLRTGTGRGAGDRPIWKSEIGKLYTGGDCPAKVGINTSSPNSALHVKGKSYFDGLAEVREGLIVQHSGGNDKILRLRNGSGINTFVVNQDGHTWAREFTVTTLDKFPDYVFKSDYKLLPLNELDTYIKQNGHLPNIPRAEEVEANGMELGELTRLQMEKIEELTLYMIEMKKELDALKQENEKLKVKIEK